MAIDTADERAASINLLVGLRVLFPDGDIDQANRQAAARSGTVILAIPPIVALDSAIQLIAAVDASKSLSLAVDSATSLKPAIDGTIGFND